MPRTHNSAHSEAFFNPLLQWRFTYKHFRGKNIYGPMTSPTGLKKKLNFQPNPFTRKKRSILIKLHGKHIKYVGKCPLMNRDSRFTGVVATLVKVKIGCLWFHLKISQLSKHDETKEVALQLDTFA